MPEYGKVEITESLLDSYVRKYNDIFGKGKGLKGKGEWGFARKLAGLTMLKVNKTRGYGVKDINAGLVYLISNPSFPNHIKVGMTLDLKKRLNSYQTYDPFRQF